LWVNAVDDGALCIRHAEPGDVEAILGMAHELAAAVNDPPPRINVARLVENAFGADRWCECFVAMRGKSAVGYALVCRGFEAHTGLRRLWLGDLYVGPEARRAGTGRALMRAVARHAIALGCPAIYWELWRKNAVGQSFYRELLAKEADDLAIFLLGPERLAALALEAES
jgi:GNAT superfamily N-acetyltransferase